MFDRIAGRLAPTPGFLKRMLAAWSAFVLAGLGVLAVWSRGQNTLADFGISSTLAVASLALSLVASLAWCWMRALQRFRAVLSPATGRVDRVTPARVGVCHSELAERTRLDRAADAPAPYVPRMDVDGPIVRALQQLGSGRVPGASGLLIVRGHPVTGKTLSALNAIMTAFPRRILLVPRAVRLGDEPDPLLELLSSTAPLGYLRSGAVLWLDAIGSRLRAGDISADVLEAFIRRHHRVVVVMTMTVSDHNALRQARGDYYQAASSVVHAAHVVTVPKLLHEEDLAEAKRLYPNLGGDLAPLPRLFAAADHVRDRWDISADEAPVSRAIVDAAIDYVRAGGLSPPPEEFLRAAHAKYPAPAPRATFDEALPWATSEIRGGGGLLERAEAGWKVPSYLVDEAIRGERAIPPGVWADVLEAVRDSVPNLLSVGCAAADAGEAAVAERAWGRAGELGDEHQRRYASMFQTALLSDQVSPELQELMQAARMGLADLLHLDGRVAAHREPEPAGAAPVPGTTFSTGFTHKRHSVARWVYRHWLARRALRILLLAAGDVGSVVLGMWLASLVNGAIDGGPLDPGDRFAEILRLLPFMTASTILAFLAYELYAEDVPRLRAAAVASALGLLGATTLVYLVARGYAASALYALLGAAFAFVLCAGFRGAYDFVSRRWLKWTGLEARTLLVGSAAQCRALAEELPRTCTRPMRFVGYLSVDGRDRDDDCRGTVDELGSVAPSVGVDRVIIADPKIDDELLMRIRDRCAARRIPVEVAVGPVHALHRAGSGRRAGPLRPIESPLLSASDLLRKRSFDVSVALLTLVALSPLILVVVVAIRLETRGPATWRTYRPGMGGRRVFGMRKFRTTIAVPDAYDDGDSPEHDGEVVTRVGRILRRFALDELPQLVNVLHGEMSLVGPRPLPIADFRRLEERHKKRYLVPPGITGIWQLSVRRTHFVGGEHVIDYDELAELDLRYAHHWSLWQDVAILARTPLVIVRRRTNLPTSAM